MRKSTEDYRLELIGKGKMVNGVLCTFHEILRDPDHLRATPVAVDEDSLQIIGSQSFAKYADAESITSVL